MSVNLYFIRHGEAASSWDKASDPGLSDLGYQQAQDVSRKLDGMTDPISIYSSPLSRARETAVPLEKLWGSSSQIVSEIAEIPSNHIPFEERRNWLTALMASRWSEQPDSLLNWRSNILKIVRAQKQDAVFFSHFMVINSIVAVIEANDQIVSFRPDNCSVTRISVENDEIKLIERGGEAITVIQ
ncbi:MAG: histidine phosphatase family protein [Sneathiella sp.]|nr:histidine phosphatase family protein [Sneathiella sp.]